jgi:hypothetical protein
MSNRFLSILTLFLLSVQPIGAAADVDAAANIDADEATEKATDTDRVLASAVAASSSSRGHSTKYIDAQRAIEHVLATRAAVEEVYVDFSVETQEKIIRIILAQAYIESHYDRDSVSRVFHGKRVTGVIRGTKRPKGVVGPLFCGVVQTVAKYSWSACLAQRDLNLGYKTAAMELAQWSRGCAKKGKRGDAILNCALSGFGGGWHSALNGSTYPKRVRSRARLIQAQERKIAKAAKGNV